MGFLDWLRAANPRRASNHHLTSQYSFLFGPTSAGRTVTERSAMQMTAVYSCVRILAEAIAGLPLHVYRYKDGGGKEKAVDHGLYRLLHDEPNPEMTSFVFRETLMTHLLLWGNAFAQVVRNGLGEVIGLYPLQPNRMSVGRDLDSKALYYEYQTSWDEPAGEYQTIRLTPNDVLHVPGLGFDGLVGYSPIAMAKNAIGLAQATEDYGASFFANGAAPGGVLEHPGTIKDPSRVREIARIFRIPPHMIGDLEKSSFSNIEQQSLEFVKYTLDPWVIRWEQAITKTLLNPREKQQLFVKFNVEGLLRGDYQSRMEGYAVARQNGWMSANDIRELENLDRIDQDDGGDLYLVNGNMLPLPMAGAYAATKQADAVEAKDEQLEEQPGENQVLRRRM